MVLAIPDAVSLGNPKRNTATRRIVVRDGRSAGQPGRLRRARASSDPRLAALMRAAAGSGAAIASVWLAPVEMAVAVPAGPPTGGGVAWPALLAPQQTILPVPAWIAQACAPPAPISVAVPAVPSTDGGGELCP